MEFCGTKGNRRGLSIKITPHLRRQSQSHTETSPAISPESPVAATNLASPFNPTPIFASAPANMDYERIHKPFSSQVSLRLSLAALRFLIKSASLDPHSSFGTKVRFFAPFCPSRSVCIVFIPDDWTLQGREMRGCWLVFMLFYDDLIFNVSETFCFLLWFRAVDSPRPDWGRCFLAWRKRGKKRKRW